MTPERREWLQRLEAALSDAVAPENVPLLVISREEILAIASEMKASQIREAGLRDIVRRARKVKELTNCPLYVRVMALSDLRDDVARLQAAMESPG